MKNLELSIEVMAKLISTTDLLGKVNVLMAKMSNPYLLTYLLESVDSISSNEIEDIHTTVDEAANDIITLNKESPYVRYREALKNAHRRLQSTELIRSNDIELINGNIRGLTSTFRKTPVKLKNSDGEVIHEGIDANQIPEQMSGLVTLINEDRTMNSIVKALLIHHKFEQIHPFTDGNGRTGRILFCLLLNKFQVLDIPASVFSYSVARNKTRYYKALNKADKGDYDFYLMEMLDLLNESLQVSILFAKELNSEIERVKDIEDISKNTKILTILNYCFVGVKVTLKYLERKTGYNIKTIIKYTKTLEDLGILSKELKGRYKPLKNLIIEKLLNKYFQ